MIWQCWGVSQFAPVGGSLAACPTVRATWLTLSQVGCRSNAMRHPDLHHHCCHLAQVRTPSQKRRHHPEGQVGDMSRKSETVRNVGNLNPLLTGLGEVDGLS